MNEHSNIVPLRQPDEIDDPLTNILRSGARQLLAQAVEMEAEAFLAAMKGLKLPDGRDRLVRHGHGPVRTIQTGIGAVEVARVKIRDRAVTSDGERIRFTSAILPLWARRTKSLDALLPVLYLRGISTGDFQEALAALLGKDAPNLSPAVVSRLTTEWQLEYERWQKRDLSARRYVYVWADGVFLQARMEDHSECMLVLIGATPEGKKELIGFQVGVRESTQSWHELLVEAKTRGLKIAPEIAVGDGALGFWKALDEVFPATRHQRCWVHKTANILNKVAVSVQASMKKDLREVYLASNRASAEVAIDVFAEKYGAKYDGRVPDERSRRNACVLRIPRRALGPLADDESHRKRVRDGPAQNGAHERFVIVNDCQVDGVQAALRRIKDLAAAERHKSVAEGHRRCQIRKRHRGHPSAGKPRRLIASSPKIPHSSDSLS
jgi:transposase-like protein